MILVGRVKCHLLDRTWVTRMISPKIYEWHGYQFRKKIHSLDWLVEVILWCSPIRSLSCSRSLDYWFRFIGSIRHMMFTPLISQLFDLSNKGSMIWIDIKYKYFWFIFLLSRMVACATCLDFFFFFSVNQTKFILSYMLTCAKKKVSRGHPLFCGKFYSSSAIFWPLLWE